MNETYTRKQVERMLRAAGFNDDPDNLLNRVMCTVGLSDYVEAMGVMGNRFDLRIKDVTGEAEVALDKGRTEQLIGLLQERVDELSKAESEEDA